MDTEFLLTSLVFSSIGIGYFVYGRKQKHKTAFYSGLALMLYPYFVDSVLWLVIAGLAFLALPFVLKLD